MAKKLFDEKKHVKIIEHEKLHFNCEIEQLDINAGERPLDMERGQERLEQVNRLPTEKRKC
jgi:hypothetical protein